ncbi:MAG TPA: type II toxin-antitoxin system mRNA interferase toxin, RelE/StbE family [Spirochaetia bacterium]|nr:MAG: hypothetical protein A2Y41_07455 [Spirochaetes bacterium GWB1_36_13]HCL56448.1 type II toxin-antitoxin system mRNA interferase toxin, RelE/StbE family [Spirochaetia bacterium]
MSFEIIYAESVKKDIKKIPTEHQSAIKKSIEKLTEFPAISNIKKLTAHPLCDYRLRNGEYRVLFDVDWNNKKIIILKIGHRKDIY